MLRIFSKWWKQGKPPSNEGRAPKPHPITIWLGLFSPALAIVAIGISCVVYRDNINNQQIAQRAYLSIENSGLFISPMKSLGSLIPRLKGTAVRIINCPMVIRNSGNTPAKILSVSAAFHLAPDWIDFNSPVEPQKPGDIGPKSAISWTYSRPVQLNPAAVNRYPKEEQELKNFKNLLRTDPAFVPANKQPRPLIYVEFTMTYEDVFHHKETLHWIASEQF